MRWPATERFYGLGRLVGLILASCPVVRRFAAYLRAQEEDLRNPKLEQLWAGGISSITLKAEGGLFVVAPLEA